MTLTYGSLFSGYGGLDLAVEDVFGAECRWHCEQDPDASKILAAHWPTVPNLGDITAVDWSQVDAVDVICGGSPCQDLSTAGSRAGMKDGTRSGLWASMCRAIEVLRPAYVIWENVSGALSACASSDLEPCPRCVGGDGPHQPVLRAAGRVLGDLASLGFDAEWSVLPASAVGAPHRRERLFLVAAHPDHATVHGERARPGSRVGGAVAADAANVGHERGGRARLGWPGPADGGDAAADAGGERLGQHAGGAPAEEAGRPGGDLAGDPRGERVIGDGRAVAFGPYAPAVARWEWILGREAPAPTEPTVRRVDDGPAGWVTGRGLSRSAELRILGNGVVRQQAAAAIRLLLARLHADELVSA